MSFSALHRSLSSLCCLSASVSWISICSIFCSISPFNFSSSLWLSSRALYSSSTCLLHPASTVRQLLLEGFGGAEASSSRSALAFSCSVCVGLISHVGWLFATGVVILRVAWLLATVTQEWPQLSTRTLPSLRLLTSGRVLSGLLSMLVGLFSAEGAHCPHLPRYRGQQGISPSVPSHSVHSQSPHT